MTHLRIHDLALGRWRNLLPILGIHERFLHNRHGPCPLCGGEDRWRFDDRGGRGTWFCNRCGSGSGVDLVMRFMGLDFRDAKAEIEKHIGEAPQAPIKADRTQSSDRFVAQWRDGMRLDGHDPASRYLAKRGIVQRTWSPMLRFVERAVYHDEETKQRSYHPAMLALFVDAEAGARTVHYTYLTSAGDKAAVPKVKKLAPCKVPAGGAVRLASSAARMGIAEGVETALSASIIFGMPVWATLSSARLIKWQPPVTAREIVIFGDNDDSFGGQNAAFSLAYRLRSDGYRVEVEIPPDVETDWNDVLQADEAVRQAA